MTLNLSLDHRTEIQLWRPEVRELPVCRRPCPAHTSATSATSAKGLIYNAEPPAAQTMSQRQTVLQRPRMNTNAAMTQRPQVGGSRNNHSPGINNRQLDVCEPSAGAVIMSD